MLPSPAIARRATALAAYFATAVFAFGQAAPNPATPPAAPAADLPVIFVCGDSTAHNNGRDRQGRQLQGWGTPFADYFDAAKAVVKNVGHAGTSSLTYYNGDWPKVLPQVKAGDYVLLVFGINDGGLRTPRGLGDEVTTVTVRPGQQPVEAHTYGWYMAKMANDVRAKGAHPVLLTVTVRNSWTNPAVRFTDATPNGPLPDNYDPKLDKIVRNDPFALLTVEVGKKHHVPVLDLNNLEADRYEQLGREKVNSFYSDRNHTFPEGADTIAAYIVAGLKAFQDSPFTPLLSEKGRALPTADPKYVMSNPAPAPGSAPASPAGTPTAPAPTPLSAPAA